MIRGKNICKLKFTRGFCMFNFYHCSSNKVLHFKLNSETFCNKILIIMTSNSMTGDGRATIERRIDLCPLPSNIVEEEWKTVFEIDRCVSWIKGNSFKKVCLQFPDEYLSFSPRILEILEQSTPSRCYILADSTYGSCCVDEKTAHHVPEAEAIIHFGQSCLSPCSNRFQVLYIFTKPLLDLDRLEKLFEETFRREENLVIVYDVIYQDVAESLHKRVQPSFTNAKLTRLNIPGTSPAESSTTTGFVKHGRFFPVETEQEMEHVVIFYIGSRALPNLLLALPNSTFKVHDPLLPSSSISTQTSTINKLIRKRNYYVEKVKDATSIGILVGTLVVQNYLDVIERLKTILRRVHKKFYVVSIGEINPCKLGNFMDIDCFIFVGCPEVVNYYISDESKGQFFQPIVTPFDVELAFCSDGAESTSGQQYIIDWAFLIAKGPPNVKDVEDDVSLITGGLRTTIIPDSVDKTSANQVINWVGLDDNEESPSTDFRQIHQGRSGIASSYADEPVVQ